MLHLKIVENLPRLQLCAMGAPLRFADVGMGQFPASQAQVLLVGHAPLRPAFKPDEAQLCILFPVPVRGQLGQTAPAGLALAHGLLRSHVVRHIGEGAHPTPIGQHACAHFEIPARRGAPNIQLA